VLLRGRAVLVEEGKRAVLDTWYVVGVDLQWCNSFHLVIAVCLSCFTNILSNKRHATARQLELQAARTSLAAERGAAVAPSTGRAYFLYPLGQGVNIGKTVYQDNTNTRHPTPTMKVTINSFRAVATWKWDLPEESDDTCGICRVNFEGTCSKCKFPGDDCPIIVGECRHCFHMVCCLVAW
jgi:anaphase-promoting complex subunit 11